MPSDRDNWFNGPSLVDNDPANIEDINDEPEYKPALDFSKVKEFEVQPKDAETFIKNAQKEGDTIISVETNPEEDYVAIRLIPAKRTLKHVVNLLLDRADEIEAVSVYKERPRFTWDCPYCRNLAHEIEEKTGMLVMSASTGPNSWDDYVKIEDKTEAVFYLHRDRIVIDLDDSNKQLQRQTLTYTQFKERK